MNAKLGYTVIAYPESMPEGWETMLDCLPFGYAYSIHDKDVNTDTGELKKAHIHFFFQGLPTKKQKEYIHACLGVHYGQDVRSASGLYDYLTHENNPDKYHYDRDSIQHSPKWSQEAFDDLYKPKIDYMGEIMQIIVQYGITEYADLLEWIVANGRQELYADSQRLWVMRYIDSRRNRPTDSGTPPVKE